MVFNVVIAALVVRWLSAALWGEMVQVMLWITIAGNIMAWGNKDYLIRNFSADPSSIRLVWQQSFGSRSLLVAILLGVLIFLPLPFSIKTWVAVYLLARFVYMSYDSIIVFRRNFGITLLLESSGFILLGAAIFFLHPAELSQLLSWFACTELLKAAAIIFIYRNRVFPVFFKSFDHIYFVLAFSFFLLYFTGMLASKIDLICVTSFFSKEEIARYQVLMSLLQATQLSIPILLIPYLAIIYRLPVASIRKMALRLFIVGMLIAAIAVFATSVLLEWIYRFQYDPLIFLLGWLIVIPGFYYAPLIYRLFRNNRQHIVVIISFLFIALSAALIFSFVRILPEPFTAIFIAMAVSQWIQVIIYFFVGRKIA